MDSSEDYYYEVQISSPEDVGVIPHTENPTTSFYKKSALKDSDCSVVEPGISQESSINHISSVYSLNEVYKENKQVNNHKEKCFDEPASIVIDSDSEKDNDCMIIDSTNSKEKLLQQSSVSHHNNVFCYDDIQKENKLLIELIEKCLDMENSAGMLRVINRTLIPLYKNADEAYKNSKMFSKILMLLIKKLDTVPDEKFSLIKTLCEELKMSKGKKRVTLKTLKSNLNGKFSTNKTKSSCNIPQKRKKMDVIDLDNYDDDDVLIDCSSDTDIQIIETRGQIINEKSFSVQRLDDIETHVEINDTENGSDIQMNEQSWKIDDDVILINECKNSCKENRASTKRYKTENCQVLSNTLFSERSKDMHNFSNNKPTEIYICNEINEIDNSNEVLNSNICNEINEIDNSNEVLNSKNLSQPAPTILNPQNDVKVHIARLEKLIAIYNKMIKKYEEAEVADDSFTSPYLQSEIYKVKVLSLYKEICELSGTESVKRHKVRLKVAPGHPEGPVKCLEDFINNNIDENGNPPFPDMDDVISCVYTANSKYQMGWSKKQIESEARALFIHYGRTAQKRRQKREWRHLLTYVKEEAPDPADHDPMLQARLQQNARVAKKNENDLLDRYAEMETPYDLPETERRLGIEHELDNAQDGDNASSPINSIPNNGNKTILLNPDSCNGNITNYFLICNPCSVPVQKVATSENTLDCNNTAVSQNVESSTDIRASMEHDHEVLISNPEYLSNVLDTEQNLSVKSIITNAQENFEVSTCETNITDSQCSNIDIFRNQEDNNNDAIQINEVTTNLEETRTVTSNIEDRVKETENEVPSSSEVRDSNRTCKNDSSDAGILQTDIKNIKKEPLDIASMLEELGDNYTATIIDIEDPFLVIEISDSSESEDEGQ